MQMPTYHQHERQTLLKAKQRQDWKTSKGVVHMYGGIDYEDRLRKLEVEDAAVHEAVQMEFQPTPEEEKEKLIDLRHNRKLQPLLDVEKFTYFAADPDEHVFLGCTRLDPGIQGQEGVRGF